MPPQKAQDSPPTMLPYIPNNSGSTRTSSSFAVNGGPVGDCAAASSNNTENGTTCNTPANSNILEGNSDAARPDTHTVSCAWKTYLEANGYISTFQPLMGHERDRYSEIIKEACDKETTTRLFAAKMSLLIPKATDMIRNVFAIEPGPEPPLGQQQCGEPQVSFLEVRKQFIQDMRTLQQGWDTVKEYLDRKPQHIRNHQPFHKAHFKTRFGILKGFWILPAEPWYLGYRPGDPIARLHQKRSKGGFSEGDMFYVPGLGGVEDEDEDVMKIYEVGCDGVIPFDACALYERFNRYALPTFIQMVIAVVFFDPRGTAHCSDPVAKSQMDLWATEFEDISEAERTEGLLLLRRIWETKYGTNTRRYPQFLKDQVAGSITKLREMGWLMRKLERDAPGNMLKGYWSRCKVLLGIVTGRDTGILAQEYLDITLAAELHEKLQDGDLEDVLIYKRSKISQTSVKIQDFYDARGPGLKLPLELFQSLLDIAGKYLNSSDQPPALSRSTNSATEPASDSRKLRLYKTIQRESGDSIKAPVPGESSGLSDTSVLCTPVLPTSTTEPNPKSNKRKFPGLNANGDDSSSEQSRPVQGRGSAAKTDKPKSQKAK